MDVIVAMGTDSGLLLLSVAGLSVTAMIIVRDTKRRAGMRVAQRVSDLFDLPDTA